MFSVVYVILFTERGVECQQAGGGGGRGTVWGGSTGQRSQQSGVGEQSRLVNSLVVNC